jgi:hypothetical protein
MAPRLAERTSPTPLDSWYCVKQTECQTLAGKRNSIKPNKAHPIPGKNAALRLPASILLMNTQRKKERMLTVDGGGMSLLVYMAIGKK